jgi:hypothetical protein
MKKIVGALVMAFVITLGIYFYMNAGTIKVKEGSPAAASVSIPAKTLIETKKPDLDLKSFDGLDQESRAILNGNGGNQSPIGDPLKTATQ